MASLLLVYGCIKPKPKPPQTQITDGILVGNEGTFQFNNASIGVWDETTNQYFEERFLHANQAPLGDILQHMWIDGDRLWLVVNNSQKIEIVDLSDFRRLTTIRPIHSPRFVAPATDTTTWVSQIWEDSIVVIHRQRLEILEKLPFPPGWSEELLPLGPWMWIASPSLHSGPPNPYLYRMRMTPPHVLDSLSLSASPTHLLRTDDTTVWVFCTGHTPSRTPPSLFAVHAQRFVVLRKYPLPASQNALGTAMTWNSRVQKLFILHGQVYALPTNEDNAELQLWLPAKGKTYYSIGYDERRDLLLLADAIDFVQRGVVEIRRPPDTNLIIAFRAGVIPSRFLPLHQ